MALNATPGAATADSYATLAEANAYNAAHSFSEAWVGTDAQKEAALKHAARLLDSSFNWTGSPVDAVQALTWPRNSMVSRNGFAIDNTVVPQALKDAQSEWARQLLADDITADSEADKEGLTRLKIGPIEMGFRDSVKGSDSVELRDADLIRRNQEFDYLWKAVPSAVRNLLPSSWYRTAIISRPLLIEAMR